MYLTLRENWTALLLNQLWLTACFGLAWLLPDLLNQEFTLKEPVWQSEVG